MIKRYFYGNTIKDFLYDSKEEIIGHLSTMHTSTFSLQGTQTNAWRKEIELLKEILPDYVGRGHVYFEYTIPRMGRRIDVVY